MRVVPRHRAAPARQSLASIAFRGRASERGSLEPRHQTRRDFLWHFGGGLGGIALSSLLADQGLFAGAAASMSGQPQFAPKAKRVVQLFMAGGASHLDLFDYKPELVKRHGQLSDFGEHVEAFQNGLGPWLRPVWDFKPYGRCGKLLSDVVA